MLKHRVIPCVLLKNWQLVKSIGFSSYRTIGHPTSTARIYNSRDVDELIVLDIDASLGDEEINLEIIADIADECFMPLTIGGNIRSLDDITAVLKAGADKVAINTKALQDSSFISSAARRFGSQCVVASIDVKKYGDSYIVYNQRLGDLHIDPLSKVLEYEALGAGEILLTSVDRDGSTLGYDMKLLHYFKNKLKIPVIINGGMGCPDHACEAVNAGADAVAAAYVFHFTQYTPNDIKRSLQSNGIPVRMN